jgi:hypothetical protein
MESDAGRIAYYAPKGPRRESLVVMALVICDFRRRIKRYGIPRDCTAVVREAHIGTE